MKRAGGPDPSEGKNVPAAVRDAAPEDQGRGIAGRAVIASH